MILKRNRDHNVSRDDYKNPEKYGAIEVGKGNNWDNFKLLRDDIRGMTLNDTLKTVKPQRVLEIGPGPGYYTRLICGYPSVEQYTAIEIGQAFLDYLKPRLKKIKKKKFKFDLVCKEFFQARISGEYDLIVLFSTVHHIPDRQALFTHLSNQLSKSGYIYCFDASHYLVRIIHLMKKLIFKGYLLKYYKAKEKIGTHHMCTWGEYKNIIKKINCLEIKKVIYKLPRKIKRYPWPNILKRWFSVEIGILIKRTH
ncbi:MAG: class I SAM-dependent methyltransferase [Spirochaetes bacterium]|nr:class I SAM-dependent methyltransferase [Spirochaetota bacterium]